MCQEIVGTKSMGIVFQELSLSLTISLTSRKDCGGDVGVWNISRDRNVFSGPKIAMIPSQREHCCGFHELKPTQASVGNINTARLTCNIEEAGDVRAMEAMHSPYFPNPPGKQALDCL